jgi:hypothetical protein
VNFPFLPRTLESVSLTAGDHNFFGQHLQAITLLDSDFYVPNSIYVPISDQVTGWTTDLILESITGCAEPFYTETSGSGLAWYLFQSGSYSSNGLPTADSATTDIVNANTGATFRLLPSVGNNALFIDISTVVSARTLTMLAGTPAMGISIMAVAAPETQGFTTRIYFFNGTYEGETSFSFLPFL